MPNSYQRKFTLGRVSDQFLNEETHKMYETTRHLLDVPEGKAIDPGEVEQDGALWLDRKKNVLKTYNKNSKEWSTVFQEKFQIVDQMTNLLPPTSPVIGQLWLYNDTLTYWNGANWKPVKALEQDGSQFSMAAFENFYMCSPLLKQSNTVINDSEYDKYSNFIKESCQDVIDNYKNRFDPKKEVAFPDINNIKLTGSSQFVVPNIKLDRVFMNNALDEKYHKQSPICIDYSKDYLTGKTPSVIHINPSHLSAIKKRLVLVDKMNPIIGIAPANTEFYGFKKGSVSGDFLRPNDKEVAGDYDEVSMHIYLNQETAKNYDYIVAVTYEFSWYGSNGTMVRSDNQEESVSYYVKDYAGPLNVFVDGYNLDDTSMTNDPLGQTVTVDEDVHNMELSMLHSTKQEYGVVQALNPNGWAVIRLTQKFNTPLVFLNGEALHSSNGDYEWDKDRNMIYAYNGQVGMTWNIIDLYDRQHDYNMFMSAGVVSDTDQKGVPIIEYDPKETDDLKDDMVLFADGLLVKKEDVIRHDISRKYIKTVKGLNLNQQYTLLYPEDIKHSGTVNDTTIDGDPIVRIDSADKDEAFTLVQDGKVLNAVKTNDVDERCIIQNGLRTEQEYYIVSNENIKMTMGKISEKDVHGNDIIRYEYKGNKQDPSDLMLFIDGFLIHQGESLIRGVSEKYFKSDDIIKNKKYMVIRGDRDKTAPSGIISESCATAPAMIRFNNAISPEDVANTMIIIDGQYIIHSEDIIAKEVDERCITANWMEPNQEYKLIQDNRLYTISGTVSSTDLSNQAIIPYNFIWGDNYLLFVDGLIINPIDISKNQMREETITTTNLRKGQEYILTSKSEVTRDAGTVTEKNIKDGKTVPYIVYDAEAVGNDINNMELYVDGNRVDDTFIKPTEANTNCITSINLVAGQDASLLSNIASKVEFGVVNEFNHVVTPAIRCDISLKDEQFALFVDGLVINSTDMTTQASTEKYISYSDLKLNDDYILINNSDIDLSGTVNRVDSKASPQIKCGKDICKQKDLKIFLDGKLISNDIVTKTNYEEECLTAGGMQNNQVYSLLQDVKSKTTEATAYKDGTTNKVFINYPVEDENAFKSLAVFVDGILISPDSLIAYKSGDNLCFTIDKLSDGQQCSIIRNDSFVFRTCPTLEGVIDCSDVANLNDCTLFIDGMMIPSYEYELSANKTSIILPSVRTGQEAILMYSNAMTKYNSLTEQKGKTVFARFDGKVDYTSKNTIMFFVNGLYVTKEYVYVQDDDIDALQITGMKAGQSYFILTQKTIHDKAAYGKVSKLDDKQRPVIERDSTMLDEDAFTVISQKRTAAADGSIHESTEVIPRNVMAITDGSLDCYITADGLKEGQDYVILHDPTIKVISNIVKNKTVNGTPMIDGSSIGITKDNVEHYAFFIDGVHISAKDINIIEALLLDESGHSIGKSSSIQIEGLKLGQEYTILFNSKASTKDGISQFDKNSKKAYVKYAGLISDNDIENTLLFIDGILVEKNIVSIVDAGKRCIEVKDLHLGQSYFILNKIKANLERNTVSLENDKGYAYISCDADKLDDDNLVLIVDGKLIADGDVTRNLSVDDKTYLQPSGLVLGQEYTIVECSGALDIHNGTVIDRDIDDFPVINYGRYGILETDLNDMMLFIDGVIVKNDEIRIDKNFGLLTIAGLRAGQDFVLVLLKGNKQKFGVAELDESTKKTVVRYSASFNEEEIDKSLFFIDGILVEKDFIVINTSDKRCLATKDNAPIPMKIGQHYEIINKRKFIIEENVIKDVDAYNKPIINYEFPDTDSEIGTKYSGVDASSTILLFVDDKIVSNYKTIDVTKKVHLSALNMRQGQSYTIIEDGDVYTSSDILTIDDTQRKLNQSSLQTDKDNPLYGLPTLYIPYGKFGITNDEVKEAMIFIDGLIMNKEDITIYPDAERLYVKGMAAGQQYTIALNTNSHNESGYVKSVDYNKNAIIRYMGRFTEQEIKDAVLFIDGILMDGYYDDKQQLINIETEIIPGAGGYCVEAPDLKLNSKYMLFRDRDIAKRKNVVNYVDIEGETVIRYDFEHVDGSTLTLILDKEVVPENEIIIKQIDKCYVTTNGLMLGQEYVLLRDRYKFFYDSANISPALPVGVLSESLVYLNNHLICNDTIIKTNAPEDKIAPVAVNNEVKLFVPSNEIDKSYIRVYDYTNNAWVTLPQEDVKAITNIANSYENSVRSVQVKLNTDKTDNVNIFAYKYAAAVEHPIVVRTIEHVIDQSEFYIKDMYTPNVGALSVWVNGIRQYEVSEFADGSGFALPDKVTGIVAYTIETPENGNVIVAEREILTKDNLLKGATNVYKTKKSLYPGRIIIYIDGVRMSQDMFTIIDNYTLLINADSPLIGHSSNFPVEKVITENGTIKEMKHTVGDTILVEVRPDLTRQEMSVSLDNTTTYDISIDKYGIPENILEGTDEVLIFVNGLFMGLQSLVGYKKDVYRRVITIMDSDVVDAIANTPLKVYLDSHPEEKAKYQAEHNGEAYVPSGNTLLLDWR